MKPDVVADVGNSRIKWGLCRGGAIQKSCSLPADGIAAWLEKIKEWQLTGSLRWAVAGVHPTRRDHLIGWLHQRGDSVVVVDDPRDIPLRVDLPRPDHVGVDRLLDAVAANSRRTPGQPAAIVDAGSAITVDRLDETGTFLGGAILPGMRLMAEALHAHTALLPMVETPRRIPHFLGKDTRTAIEAGLFWGAYGGIERILREYSLFGGPTLKVFFTGGDSLLFKPAFPEAEFWPEMTLEGIRLSAEALL
jgi:type III pantothenate kinase